MDAVPEFLIGMWQQYGVTAIIVGLLLIPLFNKLKQLLVWVDQQSRATQRALTFIGSTILTALAGFLQIAINTDIGAITQADLGALLTALLTWVVATVGHKYIKKTPPGPVSKPAAIKKKP
jgi:amino acid permease